MIWSAKRQSEHFNNKLWQIKHTYLRTDVHAAKHQSDKLKFERRTKINITTSIYLTVKQAGKRESEHFQNKITTIFCASLFKVFTQTQRQLHMR